MTKHFSLILLLAVLFVPAYVYSEPLPPQGSDCPCETAVLSNGLSGNDILAELCPGGELGAGTEYVLSTTRVAVFQEEVLDFSVQYFKGNPACSLFAEGAKGQILILSDLQSEVCQELVVASCNLKFIRPVPTLSEWGLIAMAGVLGIIGLVAIRRKRAVA